MCVSELLRRNICLGVGRGRIRNFGDSIGGFQIRFVLSHFRRRCHGRNCRNDRDDSTKYRSETEAPRSLIARGAKCFSELFDENVRCKGRGP